MILYFYPEIPPEYKYTLQDYTMQLHCACRLTASIIAPFFIACVYSLTHAFSPQFILLSPDDTTQNLYGGGHGIEQASQLVSLASVAQRGDERRVAGGCNQHFFLERPSVVDRLDHVRHGFIKYSFKHGLVLVSDDAGLIIQNIAEDKGRTR